jgi:hypothetical protein
MDHRETRVSDWVEVYTRCMDGEFFRGEYCPRDGHSNDTSSWIAKTVEELRTAGSEISISELKRRGFEGDLGDVMVVAFAHAALAPDWLRPEG